MIEVASTPGVFGPIIRYKTIGNFLNKTSTNAE